MTKKTVHFVSLGCPKNLVDSEIMAGTLMKDGYEVAENPLGVDTVVVNTCGFIEDSKKESIQKILEMEALKKKGSIKNLVVAGCLTQRYKNDLVEGFPEADLFIGSGEFQNISKILKTHEGGDSQKTFFNLPTYLQEDSTPRVNSQPGHRAYIKISEGCMKRCSFCAIPRIRGNLQSRPVESVVKEARSLVENGVKEIIIISHDFTDYGKDLRKKNPTATDSPVQLLRELNKIEKLYWIRLMYLYPDGITLEMLKTIKESSKIVKYFDVPLQHISDSLLEKMNRKMTRAEIETVLDNIRQEIPTAIIRTQFIVGFPGETQEDFDNLLYFVTHQQFDHVGCFKYSPEENTPAGKRKDQIGESTKEKRFNALMGVQQKISRKKHQSFVGKTLEVVVEGYSEETNLLLKGRFFGQAPDIDGIILINEGVAHTGDIVQVEITDSMEYDLIGRIT